MPVTCADYEMPPAEVAMPPVVQAEAEEIEHRPVAVPTAPSVDDAGIMAFVASLAAASNAIGQFVMQLSLINPEIPGAPTSAEAAVREVFQTQSEPAPETRPQPGAEEEAKAIPPESSSGRDFKTTIESNESAVRNHLSATNELETLLERSIRLLDMLVSRPAPRNAAAMQQQLDNIEQRLASGAYPQ